MNSGTSTNVASQQLIAILIAWALFTANGSAQVAVPAAAASAASTATSAATATPTLFDFLGVPQIAKGVAKIGKGVFNTGRRLLPFGETPPPAGQDKANAKPDDQKSPGEKSVEHDMKAKEAAKADAQAIEYLAAVGCGDCNPDVEETLYNGLESCFPAVRAAAARTVRISSCNGCPGCNKASCCSQRIRERLMKLGFGVDHNGCLFEQDPEVSRQCRLAFHCCQCSPLEESETLQPFTEGPPEETDYLPPPSEDANKAASKQHGSVFSLVNYKKQGGVPWARVNNEPVYRSQILRRVESQVLYDDAEAIERRRKVLISNEIQSAIDNRLIVQTARQSHFAAIGDPGSFSDDLERDAAIAEQYLQKLSRHHPISEQQIESYFESHHDNYVAPAEVYVEELRIPVRDKSQAEKIIRYLMNRNNRKSDTLTIRRSELKPFAPRWVSVTEIENAGLFKSLGSLRRGDISDVLPTQNGHRVFRVLGRRPERLMTFEEARETVVGDLRSERAALARKNLVRFLRQRSDYWDIQGGVKLAKNRDLRPNR